MQIYLARNNQQAGPYTLVQVNQMLATGQVLLDDLVWHEGMPQWKKLGELTGGQLYYNPQGTEPEPAGIPVNLNKSWADHNKQPAASDLDSNLAGVEKRFIAKVIDLLLLWVPLLIIIYNVLPASLLTQIEKIQAGASFPTHQQQQEIMLLVSKLPEQTLSSLFIAVFAYVFGYYILQAFLLKKNGQTIGKKVLGIRIVDEQTGEKTSLVRSFLIRSLAFVLLANLLSQFKINGMIIYIIDYAFVFSKRRQTLHDRLARTVVVNTVSEQQTKK